MKLSLHKQAKPWVFAAAGLALSLSAPHAAQAAGQAYALISYTNFLFQDVTNGGVLELGVDVTVGSFGDSVQHIVNRTNGPGAGGDFEFGNDNIVSDGVFVDAAQACVGPGCGVGAAAENSFPAGTFGADEYNRADSLVEGAGIDLSAPNGLPQGSFVDDGSASFVAEAITAVTSTDSSTSRFTNVTAFSITPAEDLVLGLNFDAITDLIARLSNDAGAGSFARAGVNFDLSVTNTETGVQELLVGTDVNDLDESIATTSAGGFVTGGQALAVSIQTANALLAGVTYDLEMTFVSTADLNVTAQVPAPAPLALVGLGLLGMGFAGRSKLKA